MALLRKSAAFLLAAVVASVATRWLFGPSDHLPVGIVVLENGDLVQVSVMTLDDDPVADRLWTRIRDSVRE